MQYIPTRGQQPQPAAVTFEPACEFKLEQHGARDRRRGAGHSDQVVEQYGAWPEQADDARAIARLGLRSQGLIIRLAELDRPPHDRLDRLDDVRCLGGQRRALPYEIVRAGGPRIEWRTLHRE